MAEAGAVGGITPVAPAGPQDGGTKAAVPQPEAAAADGKSSALPLANTSGRAPPESAVVLAATLAGLKPGQELTGVLRRLPGQLLALLTTPRGDFLLDAADGLPLETPVTLVLTRTDRTIAALFIAVGNTPLDAPRPVQLALVALPEAAEPAPAPEAAPRPPVPPGTDGAPPAAPAPSAPLPSAPSPAAPPSSAPTPSAQPPSTPPCPAQAALPPAAAGLLPGEVISLRGSGHLSLPAAPVPASFRPDAAPPVTPHLSAPLPQPLPQPLPGAPLHAPALAQPDPLAALLDRGVMPLALHAGTPDAPARTLEASLLAATPPGETSPLTHPPARSPLARLAESGRLVTATVLPQPAPPAGHAWPGASHPQPAAPASAAPDAHAATPARASTPAPPPASASLPASAAPPAAAPPQQPVQLAIGGTTARIDLPADLPTPAPGTQLVFLVTSGHEALQALRAAAPQAPAHSALPAAASGPLPAQEASRPDAPRGAPAAEQSDAAVHARPAPTADVSAAPRPAAPENAAPASPPLPWVPGMTTPASVQPAAPALTGGEALLMAVMQALGRKGFAVGPRDAAPTGPDADDSAGDPAAPAAFDRLAPAAARSAARAAAAQAARALDTPLPASAPEALPFTLTLHTPQGHIPLVFLVWQAVRGDEENSGGTGPGGEPDVCFAVEVDFESIGRLRLRGTVGRRHLALGVETERPLGTALEQAATRDFMQALEAGGMTGTLVFRSGRASDENAGNRTDKKT